MSRLGNYSSYCQLVGHILGIESIAAWVSLDDKEVNNWHKVLALFVALVDFEFRFDFIHSELDGSVGEAIFR